MIKIGLGKALGFSLLAFIGLNFLFIIIAETINGSLPILFSDISSDPLTIITILFAPIEFLPGTVITSEIYAQIISGTIDASLIQFVGFLVSPFIAALVAGRTGESKGGSFGGWMIAALISSAAWGVYAFISAAPDPTMLLIGYMLNGVVYGIFYGCFALLFSKSEMY